jgi:hypothetical protein
LLQVQATNFLTGPEENQERIEACLTLLYGERTLSDKEKKKLAKLEKFKAKQDKQEAKPATEVNGLLLALTILDQSEEGEACKEGGYRHIHVCSSQGWGEER